MSYNVIDKETMTPAKLVTLWTGEFDKHPFRFSVIDMRNVVNAFVSAESVKFTLFPFSRQELEEKLDDSLAKEIASQVAKDEHLQVNRGYLVSTVERRILRNSDFNLIFCSSGLIPVPVFIPDSNRKSMEDAPAEVYFLHPYINEEETRAVFDGMIYAHQKLVGKNTLTGEIPAILPTRFGKELACRMVEAYHRGYVSNIDIGKINGLDDFPFYGKSKFDIPDDLRLSRFYHLLEEPSKKKESGTSDEDVDEILLSHLINLGIDKTLPTLDRGDLVQVTLDIEELSKQFKKAEIIENVLYLYPVGGQFDYNLWDIVATALDTDNFVILDDPEPKDLQ